MADGADAFHASLAFMNTNLAAAVATVVTMIFTWLRYGKPDVSMTLNASLAGLVAITAGCDCVSPFGAFVIGVVAGFLVVLSVEFFDNIARIDDPVGAVSVHMVNGIWGTVAVGLFSTGEDGVMNGLFYGGGVQLLGIQALGIIAIDAYVVITMFVVFMLIDRVIGLRVPAEVEIDGLDMHEHGLASAYSGFSVSDVSNMVMDVNENTYLGEGEYAKASEAQVGAAVKVTGLPKASESVWEDVAASIVSGHTAEKPEAAVPAASGFRASTGMHRVSIICRMSKFDELKSALNELGVTGMTMSQVMGCGIQKGSEERYRGAVVDSTLLPKVKVEVVVSKISVQSVIDAAKKALYTGHIGDGKIFVYDVTRVVKVRTGEEDFAALQDVE
jgi:Amt family ammonium transporter